MGHLEDAIIEVVCNKFGINAVSLSSDRDMIGAHNRKLAELERAILQNEQKFNDYTSAHWAEKHLPLLDRIAGLEKAHSSLQARIEEVASMLERVTNQQQQQPIQVIANSAAIASGIDYTKIVEHLDMGHLASEINLNDLAHEIDLDDLASEIDVNDELAEKIDMDELANQIDLTEVAKNVDLDDLAGYVDLDGVASKLDTDDIASKIKSDDFIDSVCKEIASRLNG